MGYTGTTNYGFQKPAKENAFTVDDLNNALDKIDETIKSQSDNASSSDTGLANRITAVEQKNTSQDTAIAGKVNVAQGAENVDKVLTVGDDGNVTPMELPKVEIGKVPVETYGQIMDSDGLSHTINISSQISLNALISSSETFGKVVERLEITNDKIYYDKDTDIIKRCITKIPKDDVYGTNYSVNYRSSAYTKGTEFDVLKNAFSFLIGKIADDGNWQQLHYVIDNVSTGCIVQINYNETGSDRTPIKEIVKFIVYRASSGRFNLNAGSHNVYCVSDKSSFYYYPFIDKGSVPSNYIPIIDLTS